MAFPAIASLGAGLIGGAAGAMGATSQANAAKDIARNRNRFELNMSNTAYQRAVADMRKAGLNPALAYQQGGASTAQGAEAPTFDIAGKAMEGASSAFQMMNVAMQTRQLAKESDWRVDALHALADLRTASGAAVEQRGLLDKQTIGIRNRALEAIIADLQLRPSLTMAQRELAGASAGSARAMAEATRAGIPMKRTASSAASLFDPILERANKGLRYLDSLFK